MKNKTTFYEKLYGAGLNVLGLCMRLLPSGLGLGGKRLILCYHSVASDRGRFSTPPAAFTGHMQWLKTNAKIVSLDEVLNGKPVTHTSLVAITFDDGYRDTLKTAAPILSRLCIPATVFAIGKPWRVNRKALGVRKKLLIPKELQQLRRQGWEIGFHTTTHARLDTMTQKEQEKEIIQGKKEFRRGIGGRIRFFAYPHGAAGTQVQKLAMEAGFQYAVTTDGWFAGTRNPMAVSRICIEGTLTDGQFRTLLTLPGIVWHAGMTRLISWKWKAQQSISASIHAYVARSSAKSRTHARKNTVNRFPLPFGKRLAGMSQ